MPTPLLIAKIMRTFAGIALFTASGLLRLKIQEPLDLAKPGQPRKMLPYLVLQGAGIFLAIIGVNRLIRH